MRRVFLRYLLWVLMQDMNPRDLTATEGRCTRAIKSWLIQIWGKLNKGHLERGAFFLYGLGVSYLTLKENLTGISTRGFLHF